jgi:hypothetical protein
MAMSVMPPVEGPSPAPGWPEGRFEGPAAFAELVRRAMAQLARTPYTPVIWSDADFDDWPLGERSVVEALHAWAGRGKEARWMARDFGAIRARHPRLVLWRATWSHLVEARRCERPPSAIWTPAWVMERIDPERSIALATTEPAPRQALRARLDACWDGGAPAFPATVLGL